MIGCTDICVKCGENLKDIQNKIIMRKKYRIRLPKDQEISSIVCATIIDGDIIVEVEQKEKISPKDGDFLVSKNTGIFIYKPSIYKGICLAYVGVNSRGIIIENPRDGSVIYPYWCLVEDCRYATEQEKNDFLERIRIVLRKRWNPEKKYLEDIRWEPRNGEEYWYVNEDFVPIWDKFSSKNTYHIFRVKINNCFKTKEATQKAADKMKEVLKGSKSE